MLDQLSAVEVVENWKCFEKFSEQKWYYCETVKLKQFNIDLKTIQISSTVHHYVFDKKGENI